MDLVTVRELYRNREQYLGKKVTVGGWVRSVRDSKAFGFIVLNDGTFFETLQVVYHDTMDNFAEVSKLNVGSAIIVTGELVATPDAKQPFEIQADEYDNNKHFFLSHYFRDHYEEALKKLPEINSGIEIRRVEVWVTQTSSGKEDARNILALTDLGDSYANGIGGVKDYELPENGKLYKTVKNLSGVRNINTVSTVLSGTMEQGPDYEKIEQAGLLKPSEYDVNTKLGYISLRSQVSSSKILAVAYGYGNITAQPCIRISEYGATEQPSDNRPLHIHRTSLNFLCLTNRLCNEAPMADPSDKVSYTE